MLMAFFLYASQALDRADALNAALANCLFSSSRAARSQGVSPDQFRAMLQGSCLAEEALARDAAVSILIRRGSNRVTAEEKINDTLRNGRAAVIRAYSVAPPQP